MTDFRMTQAAALVIRALAGGHSYGFDVMDATGLSSGTVYPTLRRMEKHGLVTSPVGEPHGGHPRGPTPAADVRAHAGRQAGGAAGGFDAGRGRGAPGGPARRGGARVRATR